MTVVSYLRLSKDCVMGSADERETHDFGGTQRTYDVSRKIFRLGELPVFVGAAGSVSNSREILQLANSRMKQDFTYRNALATLKVSYKDIRDESFQTSVLDRYGVTWADFRVGNIDTEIRKELKTGIEDPRRFGVTLLVGGYDTETSESKIHSVIYPGSTILFERTESIGSGFDTADISIGNALTGFRPYERDNIEKYIGARILMGAAQDACRNFGVGGRTQLVWLVKDKFFELGGAESNMLNNALYCERAGFLERPYVNMMFQKAVNDQAKAEDLLPELTQKIPPEKLAEIFWIQSLHV